MTKEDLTHLEWIYGRLIHVHNENRNYDYMHRFKKIIDEQLALSGVSNCNAKKDTNIENTILFINRKDGLTDVYDNSGCLGEGLDAQGINDLNIT